MSGLIEKQRDCRDKISWFEKEQRKTEEKTDSLLGTDLGQEPN